MSIAMQNIELLLRSGPGIPFSLVNGEYADGKVIVSGGNHITVTSSPGQWIFVDIPFTEPFPVVVGDVLCFKASGTGLGNAHNQNMGFRIGGSHKQQNNDRVYSDTTYTINVLEDGLCDAFFLRDRANSLEEDVTVTLSHNGEVLL